MRNETPVVTIRRAVLVALVFFAVSAHAQTLTIYDDALENSFENFSYGPPNPVFSNTTPTHSGSNSIAFTPSHFANGVSFHYPDGSGNLSTATYPVLRFWVHGGTTGGQQLSVLLSTDNVYNLASVAVTPVANTWTEVVVNLSQAPFSAVNFDRIDIIGSIDALQPVLYIDDVTLGQASAGPPVSIIQYGQGAMVAGMTSETFAWQDSLNHPRVAALAHHILPTDPAGPGGSRGGALRQYAYQLSDGTTRTATVTTYPNGGYGGFGYIVSHERVGPCATGDDSPLGFVFGGTWERVFEGRHHAIFRFRQNYPRNCPNTGPAGTRYLPVTIDWVFSTGHDNPLWAVTYDVDLIAATGGAVAAADTYFDDSRAPYGELNIDGDGSTNLNGVAWGDRYKFTTTNVPANTDLTWNSPFNWTVANTVPYVKEWLAGPLTAGKLDAVIGIVQTQTITQQDAGGSRDLSIGRDITPYWHKTDANNVHSAGIHVLPDGDNWPYQAMGDNFFDDNGSNNARMTWKTQYGFLGQTAYTINGGAVESSAATAPGYPKKSYSTYVVLGQHTTVPEPVDAQVTQVETVQSLTLTTNGGIGSVVISGPAGITRVDTPDYHPAGYNHVYGALAFTATSNNLDANIAVGNIAAGPGTLKKPLIIVGNYTAAAPQLVTLAGVTLVADVDYFASPRSNPNELWITLNRDLTGATNELVINGVVGGLNPPTNVVAAALSLSSVQVSWAAAAGAVSYEVSRTSNNSTYTAVCGNPTPACPIASPFTDATASSGNAYLYKVKSVDALSNKSAFSNGDLATTVIFTDPTLTAQSTLVKAVHITDLRTAVTAVCTLAGNPPPCGTAFTDPTLTAQVTKVKKLHVTELRARLDAARPVLGLTVPVEITDPTITANTTVIKAAHITDLRNGVK